MKRRKFIATALATSLGTLGMPYLLPSGRLFARTQDVRAKHVVVVLFAGGIRQQESVLQRYLAGSQNETIPGNILPNLFAGAAPEDKIVYGRDGVRSGEIPLTPLLASPLQQQGTLFRELRTSNVGHYGGLNLCLQGHDLATQGLRQHPLHPTMFEYVRRHAGLPAEQVWFIGSGIGNSLPLLSHSMHEKYGPDYGANFLAPNITFGRIGQSYLAGGKQFHPEFELDPMQEMKAFLDLQYDRVAQNLRGTPNTTEAQYEIRTFLEDLYLRTQTQEIIMPPMRDNGDLTTMGYACEVLARFQPALTVVNLEQSDVCHSHFTHYLRNLHRADHAVGFLWRFIQENIPEMAPETILLLAPECGRNQEPNPIRDENDWFAYDHSDENSQRVFGMMVGKNVPANLEIGSFSNPVGLTADLVPTVADILGIKDTVYQQGLIHPAARSWFDRL